MHNAYNTYMVKTLRLFFGRAKGAADRALLLLMKFLLSVCVRRMDPSSLSYASKEVGKKFSYSVVYFFALSMLSLNVMRSFRVCVGGGRYYVYVSNQRKVVLCIYYLTSAHKFQKSVGDFFL